VPCGEHPCIHYVIISDILVEPLNSATERVASNTGSLVQDRLAVRLSEETVAKADAANVENYAQLQT
jgi:hypothetical protein